MKRNIWPLLLACIALTGCASTSASKAPGADLTKYKTYYVIKRTEDDADIEKIIADQLTSRGLQAASGIAPAEGMPAVDAVVVYDDHWMWDLTMYMTRLSIYVREVDSGMIVARAESFRPSLQRKTVKGMVQEVLTKLFEQ